jgi:phosphate:Na+ symporter
MASMVVLDLMGAVALLLWGLRMVRSGIMRTFGSDLRRILGIATHNRFAAFVAGIGITAVLQSSTATGLMASSFAARGLMDLVPALAVMLGANVGTTLIVQVLSFNVSAVAPVLFLMGLLAFNFGRRTWIHDVGRAAIGLGLMLLALHILLDTLVPAENAPSVRTLLHAITGDPLLCVLVAALLTWAAHSSAAVVLFVMSLCYAQFITPVAALALVLGANLGAAVNPVLESGTASNPATRRLPIGNVINRAVGVALALPFLQPTATGLSVLEHNPARMAADFHTAFNIVFAVIFIFLLDPFAALLVRLLPERQQRVDPSVPLYLDESMIGTPGVALACAAREALHIGDIVEAMLNQAIVAIMTSDRKLVAQISRTDNVVDRLYEAVKHHITKLTRESLEEEDGRRAMEIMSFAINLEHIGDIIDRNLMELAIKKIKHRYSFSREGASELKEFHQRVLNNLRLGFSVLMSHDVKVARVLIEEKTRLRDLEMAVAEKHLARLREGRQESIETSSLHLDVLRDLKRIHSHICSVAYPVLEAAGELQPSRLKGSNSAVAVETAPLAHGKLPADSRPS